MGFDPGEILYYAEMKADASLNNLIGRSSRPERKWAVTFGLLLAGITLIPYLIGFFVQGSDWRFSGFVFGVEDGNSYIAKMLTGATGSWLFRSPYTAYPQNGFLAFFPYLLLGKLASPPSLHEQLVVLFQLFRIAGVLVMALGTYEFTSLFLSEPKWRKLATALSMVGGGFGWLYFLGGTPLWQGRIPLEFYSPETFGFLSVYGLPHLAFARGLLLLGIVFYINGQVKTRYAILAAVCWFLLAFMQPATLASGWLLIGIHLIAVMIVRITRREWVLNNLFMAVKPALIIYLITGPFLLYNVWSFLFDPYFQAWGQQNKILSPPVTDYILAWALVLPFVCIALVHIFRRITPSKLFLAVWVFIAPVLAYLPFNLQRRLPEGSWAAFSVLAVLGLLQINMKTQRLLKRTLYFSFLPAVFLLASGLFGVFQIEPPQYLPVSQIDAFLWLANIAKPGDVLLASYDTSNAAPAWVPIRTVTGHGPESIHLDRISKRVEMFYCTGSVLDRLRFLEEIGVNYVYWGPQEKQLSCVKSAGGTNSLTSSPAFSTGLEQELQLIYSRDGHEIFRFDTDGE